MPSSENAKSTEIIALMGDASSAARWTIVQMAK
jgi:hypothetical protein